TCPHYNHVRVCQKLCHGSVHEIWFKSLWIRIDFKLCRKSLVFLSMEKNGGELCFTTIQTNKTNQLKMVKLSYLTFIYFSSSSSLYLAGIPVFAAINI
ncbi:MAG: hypothetical protein ACOCWC_05380, partial [Bacteroidota bacterium]